MPSSCQISGRRSTAKTWNTSVREEEISAEVRPSLRAVKKPEPKMAKPEKRKEKA